MNQSFGRNVSLLATAALLLAGCGVEIVHPFGNEVGEMIAAQAPTVTSPPPAVTLPPPTVNENQTPAGVERAAYRTFAALQTRNANASYAQLTKACQQVFGNRAAYSLFFRVELTTMEAVLGWNISKAKLLDVRVVDFTLSRATVTGTYDLGDGTLFDIDDDPDVVVYEDGEWKSDCGE